MGHDLSGLPIAAGLMRRGLLALAATGLALTVVPGPEVPGLKLVAGALDTAAVALPIPGLPGAPASKGRAVEGRTAFPSLKDRPMTCKVEQTISRRHKDGKREAQFCRSPGAAAYPHA